MRPLIVIRRTPKIDFMAWHKLGFAFSLLLTLSSIALFSTIGLNYGIDFIGGTLIEVRATTGPADFGDMRGKLDARHIGEGSLLVLLVQSVSLFSAGVACCVGAQLCVTTVACGAVA